MNQDSKNVRKSSFGFLMKTLSSRLDGLMKEELKKHDLNIKHFGTLMMIFEMEGRTQNEIGKLIEIPGYATTRILDDLEKKGLTYRVCPPENRRTHRVYLTEDGKKYKSILPAIVVKVNKEILQPLDDGEREQLIQILQKLIFREE